VIVNLPAHLLLSVVGCTTSQSSGPTSGVSFGHNGVDPIGLLVLSIGWVMLLSNFIPPTFLAGRSKAGLMLPDCFLGLRVSHSVSEFF
jgi:uncharacterized membrane protein